MISFETDDTAFPADVCTGRLYIRDVDGSKIEKFAQAYGGAENLTELVFLVNSKDTRFDERAVLRLRYFDRADWDGICAVLFSDRQDYLERIDSYQNRTYKAHGRALLRMAEILKETEAPAVKGSKRQ